MKVVLSLYEEDPNLEIKKSEPKSNKGSLKKSNFKKTGGKQILFLAVCPGVPENYNNYSYYNNVELSQY